MATGADKYKTWPDRFNSFTGVGDKSAGDFAFLHKIVDFLQLAQSDELKGRFDQTTVEEVDGFARVLAVSDIAALDGSHLDHGFEDGYA